MSEPGTRRVLISLEARQRERFRKDLQKHREMFSLNDADYAAKILKVLLNTLKRSLEPNSKTALALERSTFINVFVNADMDPATSHPCSTAGPAP